MSGNLRSFYVPNVGEANKGIQHQTTFIPLIVALSSQVHVRRICYVNVMFLIPFQYLYTELPKSINRPVSWTDGQ